MTSTYVGCSIIYPKRKCIADKPLRGESVEKNAKHGKNALLSIRTKTKLYETLIQPILLWVRELITHQT